jgi:hypothetical protein
VGFVRETPVKPELEGEPQDVVFQATRRLSLFTNRRGGRRPVFNADPPF